MWGRGASMMAQSGGAWVARRHFDLHARPTILKRHLLSFSLVSKTSTSMLRSTESELCVAVILHVCTQHQYGVHLLSLPRKLCYPNQMPCHGFANGHQPKSLETASSWLTPGRSAACSNAASMLSLSEPCRP